MAAPAEKQMSMMLEGGGLKDQGGTVDPVSGNEVPDGATQEGVRDDVPAMLSEGEYVMNEASTRYHGVDKLNAMQEEAKQGYNQMEKDGLMGQPTQGEMLDDSIPFGMGDINVEDDQGQELMMADGGLVPKGFYHGGMHDERGRPIQATSGMRTLNTQNQPNRPQPSFGDSMGGFGGFTFKNYQHPDGRNMMVPFMNGVPMFSIPEGFVEVDLNNPLSPAPPTSPVLPPAEVVKPVEFGGGPDDPESGQVKSFEDMTPEDRQKARDFYNKDSKLKSVLQAIPFTKFLVNQGEKSLRAYDKKTLDFDIQNENKKRDAKAAIALAEKKAAEEKTAKEKEIEIANLKEQYKLKGTTEAQSAVALAEKKAAEQIANLKEQYKLKSTTEAQAAIAEKNKRDAEIKSQQELFDKLAADKAAADKRNEQLTKELEAANLNKDIYNVSDPTVKGVTKKDVDIAEAVAAEGKSAKGIDGDYTGGPDGYSGSGPDGYSGGDANSGGDFSGADFGGSFGYFNQGGLAGKKPKKKMKTYKKGGLATR